MPIIPNMQFLSCDILYKYITVKGQNNTEHKLHTNQNNFEVHCNVLWQASTEGTFFEFGSETSTKLTHSELCNNFMWSKTFL